LTAEARRKQSELLIVLAVYAALSIFWTWPLAAHMASRIAFDPGDPFLNTWILWWNAQAVPFTDAWWSPPIFYPMRGALALSEHLAGIAVFTTPLLLLGGTPALAYNTALLMSYALSGLFTYLLVVRLTGSRAAAFCAGLAYAFAPFRAGQLSHLQVLTSQWLPAQLLGLHAFVETGRRRWLAVFGAAWVLQSLSNGYYLLFAPVLLALWICWFVLAQREWRKAAEIGAAWLIATVPLIPAILQYWRVHNLLGLARPRSEIVRFSADWGSFLNPPQMLAVWPVRPVPTIEDFLFPGVTMIAIVVIALLLLPFCRSGPGPARPALRFYVVAAVFMAALTFGPAPPDTGPIRWVRPYEWLLLLPGYSGVRVPVRFAMVMALCLAVAGGVAFEMMIPADKRRRMLLAILVAFGISVDGLMEAMPMSAPPGGVEFPEMTGAAVLELPPDDTRVNIPAMMRAMKHGLPLVNGYSGHFPTHYGVLGQSLRRNDPSAIIELARGRPLLIIVSDRRDPAGHFRRLVESIPGIERGGVSGGGIWYVLRAQPGARRPSGGTALPHTAAAASRNHLLLDLGRTHVVSSVEFLLGVHWRKFPRELAIDMSVDGTTWERAWDDWTGGVVLAGALEDQLRVPVRLALPGITARYLRLHPAQAWQLPGLTVSGP